MKKDDAKYCMTLSEFEDVIERLLDSIKWVREFIGSDALIYVIGHIATELWIQQTPESKDSAALRYQMRAHARNGVFDLYERQGFPD